MIYLIIFFVVVFRLGCVFYGGRGLFCVFIADVGEVVGGGLVSFLLVSICMVFLF